MFFPADKSGEDARRLIVSNSLPVFEIAGRISTWCEELLLSLKVDQTDPRKIVCSILFKRLQSGFQALALLCERGMMTEARIQWRSMLDGLFVTGALWQEPDLINIWMAQDIHRRRKLYKEMKELGWKKLHPEFPSDEQIESELSKLDSDQADFEKKHGCKLEYLAPSRLASYAKLSDFFRTQYLVASEAVHHSGKDIEQHLTRSMAGDSLEITICPESESVGEFLCVASDTLLKGAFAVAGVFELDIKADFQKLTEVLDRQLEEFAKQGIPKVR